MDPILRTAQLGDVGALQELFRRSSLSNDGDRASLLAHPEALVLDGVAVREARTRVALVDDQIVGFATLRPVGSAMELDDLFVDPNFMRRGIASGLMRDAADLARARGVARIEVTANGHALAFYEHAGFEAAGTVETDFGPGIRMHLDLGRGGPFSSGR